MSISRRIALQNFLFGAGFLGLRSLASGLPMALLANPRRALARETLQPAAAQPQYLIMSASKDGCPLNGNVPGTYEDPAVVHPRDPTMAPQTLRMGGVSCTAAAPWATLPPDVLSHTCFFHQSTNTLLHPDQTRVMGLMSAVAKDEMLVSLCAKHLAKPLGTVQAEPVCLGAASAAECLTFAGSPQPMIAPTALSALLATPTGPLAATGLQKMRDADLNALNAFFKAHGHPGQRAFVDAYARSQAEVRNLSTSLLHDLHGLQDNSVRSQLRATVILIRMNLAPAYTVHIPFGGDNHHDPDLENEATEHVDAVALINDLWRSLQEHKLDEKVTFATLNVFGRSMAIANQGYGGRSHNENHHVGVMIGKRIRGGVIGGIAPFKGDYGATAIHSSSGAGDAGGDIARVDTMAAYGMTLATAVGVPHQDILSNIRSSTANVVAAALV